MIKGKDYSQENRGAKVKALLVRGHIKIIFKRILSESIPSSRNVWDDFCIDSIGGRHRHPFLFF